MEIKFINVYSQKDFEEKMKQLNLDSSNVEIKFDKAFISIIGTPQCIEHYLHSEDTHWFKNNCHNVLNLEFDDIDEESKDWKGQTFYGITEEQAKQCVEFIEQNRGKNFYIHCRAGKSRSQGICRYILDMYGKEYGYDETKSCRKDNPCLTPNIRVVSMLKREFYKINGYNIED